MDAPDVTRVRWWRRVLAFRPANGRAFAAYVLMGFFVLFTSLGAAMMYLPAGFVTAGVASGLYGYLLGRE